MSEFVTAKLTTNVGASRWFLRKPGKRWISRDSNTQIQPRLPLFACGPLPSVQTCITVILNNFKRSLMKNRDCVRNESLILILSRYQHIRDSG
ncbi:hypothetical protein ABKN59_006401 [Abortiporus biennis]